MHVLCSYHATRPHATPPYLLGLLPDLFFGLVRIFCHAGLSSWSDVAGRRFEGAAKKVLLYPVLFWGDVICHISCCAGPSIEFLSAKFVESWLPLSLAGPLPINSSWPRLRCWLQPSDSARQTSRDWSC